MSMSNNQVTYLTEDCFDQIINYLNDRNTLYSCLFVSRNFCRKITPKLWGYPSTFSGQRRRHSRSLIHTYVSCLSEEQRKSMEEYGLQISVKRNPLFPYLLFLKEFDFRFFESSIADWVRAVKRRNPKNNERNRKRRFVLNKFFIFLLKLLLRDRDIQILRWYNNEKDYRMPYIKNLFNAFNIKELYCGGYQLSPFFYKELLSKGCTKIVKMDILRDHKVQDRGLSTLIKRQEGLQSITFRSLSGGTCRTVDSLISQARSLVSVRFEDTDFTDASSEGFALCNNLKTMEFLDCRTDDMNKLWEPLIRTSEIRLSKLTLVQTQIIPLALETILMKSNSELENLTVDKIVIESMPNFLEILKLHCVNITYLKISFVKVEFFQTLSNALRSFTKLKSLVIRATTLCIKSQLTKFGKRLPKSLRLLDMDFEISARSLNKFLLRNCVAPLERLVLNFSLGFSDEHLKAILYYVKKKGTLRSIGFTYRSIPETFIVPIVTEEMENEVKKMVEINNPNDHDDHLF